MVHWRKVPKVAKIWNHYIFYLYVDTDIISFVRMIVMLSYRKRYDINEIDHDIIHYEEMTYGKEKRRNNK